MLNTKWQEGTFQKDLSTNLFPKLDTPLLTIGRVKIVAAKRKSGKIHMTALSRANSDKPITQDAKGQAVLNDGPEIRTIKPIGSNALLSTNRII